jgi:GT2 family glycosyltransferase
MTRVSVLLPVYNGAAFLRTAIDSILAQTFADFELLVVDDGSTDGSADVAASYADGRVRVLRQGVNRGLAEALNRGLEEARAPLVARQDADDVSHRERLAHQVGFLEKNAEIALVGTQAWEIDAHGRRRGGVDKPQQAPGITWTMMFDNAFVHTSVMFRRDVVRGLGGYDPTFVHCQDYDLWERLLRVGAAANLGTRLLSSRLHPASMTETIQNAWRPQALQVMARAQERALGRAVGPEDAAVLATVREGVPPGEKPHVFALLARLREEFVGRMPAASRSEDFHYTLRRQYANVVASCGFRPWSVWPAAVAQAGLGVVPPLARRAAWALRNRLVGRG